MMINSPLHFPKLYSLKDAALELNHSEDEILFAAANGSMKVMFGLRPDFEIQIAQLELDSEEVKNTRPTEITPMFFALEATHCLRLMASKLALVDLSDEGYLYREDRDFLKLKPSQAENYVTNSTMPARPAPRLTKQRFAFYENGKKSKCPVTKDMVFLQTEQLVKFRESLNFNLCRPTPKDLPENYQHKGILREHESHKLDKMYIAASKFWFVPWIEKNDNRTYPKTKDIENWFISQKFTPTLAKHAASLIRPEWAVMGAIKKPEDE